MNSNRIKIGLGDWMWNASVVGFINIVGKDNIYYMNQDTVEFSEEVLESFEEKYFKYLIETYEKTLSWFKIVEYKKVIDYFQENNFESFNLQSLQRLNIYVKNTLKNYIKSNSYKAAYEFIGNDIDVLKKEKEVLLIKEPKNVEQFEKDRNDIIANVKYNFEKIKEIISYCSSEKGKKYLAGKNVIYTIIRNSWDGVSFLNPQTKEKDIYLDYKNYFVEPAKEYIKADKKKYKYNCFICNEPMKDIKNDLSFLNATGFDVNRKSSHVWNFNNDIAICPICKLIYSCIPAGMVYVYNRGIYINENFSINSALKINNNLKYSILKSDKYSSQNIYRSLVDSINIQINDKIKYELADIQVIRYENENNKHMYKFNILSRNTLEIITKSKKELNLLINASFREVKTNFNIYDLVINRLFNNQNLYTLIHKTILYRLSDPRNCYYHMGHIKNLLYINEKILGGMGYMKNINKEIDIVKEANTSGYHLREEYKKRDVGNKLSGISYRLLNALKTGNKNMFMDVALNCYLYVKKTVPRILIEALKEDDAFKTIGYTFVAGLIDEKTNKEIENN